MHTLYQDMAGNAWSGPTMCALFLSIIRYLTEKHPANFSRASAQVEHAASDDDDVFADILRM
jgi:hypothetical protein